jgi:hypothetical protein
MFPAPDETIVRRSREIIAESWEIGPALLS